MTTQTNWTRVEPGAYINGDQSEYQIGDSWCNSWTRPIGGGLHAFVARSYYLETCADDPDGGPDPDYGVMLWHATEYLVCRDQNMPGDTEVVSDGRTACISGPHDLRAAPSPEEAAKTSLPPTDDEWNNVIRLRRLPGGA